MDEQSQLSRKELEVFAERLREQIKRAAETIEQSQKHLADIEAHLDRLKDRD